MNAPVSVFDLSDQFQREAFAQKIKADIDEFCRVYYDNGYRSHLGGSIIGEECLAKLWLTFRWAKHEDFDGRMQRLFNRGHESEARFALWLYKGAGFEISNVDPETGEQHRISDVEGHFGGSLDSIATHPLYPGVLFMPEYKTIHTKGFSHLKEDRVKIKSPLHWAQMCVYGFKRGIRYAIYCVINKNDDDIHIEVLQLDWEFGKELIDKGKSIILSREPPPRCSDNPAYFKCKDMCPMWGVCHDKQPVDRNCRACRNSRPIENAEWYCDRYNQVIPNDWLVKAALNCEQFFAIAMP